MSTIIKACVITLVVMIIIYFVFYHKKPIYEKYKIQKSIKPFEFQDGLGSKYYVEVLRDRTVILSLSEGINYLTNDKKNEMYNKAVAYIQKCRDAEK